MASTSGNRCCSKAIPAAVKRSFALAWRDRFPVILEMDFPPPAQEVAILSKRSPGLGGQEAKQLIQFAGRQRELAREGEFNAQVSTRTLLAAGRQVAAGVPLANAVR